MDTIKQSQGNLNIGLKYYQEEQWISAINIYGQSIMDKSLLSSTQKSALLAEYKTRSNIG